REIEAVVPSMDAWVSLVSDVASDEVTIAADCWKRIVAIGSGSTVGGVARTLDLGELDVCRSMKELVELGLVEVGTAPAGGRHLAGLSPKAARAVAAAAKASTSDEREAALAEAAEDDDEPINRGLLLKFLSSVKS